MTQHQEGYWEGRCDLEEMRGLDPGGNDGFATDVLDRRGEQKQARRSADQPNPWVFVLPRRSDRRAFAERLLGSVTRPFYDILRHWIYDGELSDPYHEFFVKEQTSTDNEIRKELKEKGLTSVWDSKYEVDDRMVPSIITAGFCSEGLPDREIA